MRGGPPPSVGRPGRTTTERQGVVDGALGPANDTRDDSAAQTPGGVAARDGQEGFGTTPCGNDCGLAAGLIEAELAQLVNASSVYSMRIIGEYVATRR
eukprot:scaffold5502_cov48-Phaeocystis_antarctica.AAC.2